MLADLLLDRAPAIDRLYILGDLFDFWIGDDGVDLLGHRATVELIRSISDRDIAVFLMRGNRDFLIGQRLCEQAGATLLHDSAEITIYDQKVIMCHGDHLCTDDVDHQKFREKVLNPEWQRNILNTPLQERHRYATEIRAYSNKEKKQKTNAIMDVTATGVAAEFDRFESKILIHGHTHRPAIHKTDISTNSDSNNDRLPWRLVLGDWLDSPSYLQIDQQGMLLESGSGRGQFSTEWP